MFTKGDWKLQEEPFTYSNEFTGGKINHYFVVGNIGGSSDRTIADIGEWTDRPNALDDARLISAAPDMFNILRGLINDPEHFSLLPPHYKQAISKALAKAVQ